MNGVPIHLEMDDHWGSPYDHGNPQMSLWETFDLFQHPHFRCLCGDSFTSMVETVDFLPIFVTALYSNPSSDGIYIQEDLTPCEMCVPLALLSSEPGCFSPSNYGWLMIAK